LNESLPGRIFISYRRQETGWPAGRLYDLLIEHFPAEQVFKDVDNIDPGDDFVERITAAVASCDVLLALIGPHWLTITDENGQRRLDNPKDWVRLEIETALARRIRVIPILVDDARMPRETELPVTLSPLIRRNAVRIDPLGFDTRRLISAVNKTLAEVKASHTTARSAAPTSAARHVHSDQQVAGPEVERLDDQKGRRHAEQKVAQKKPLEDTSKQAQYGTLQRDLHQPEVEARGMAQADRQPAAEKQPPRNVRRLAYVGLAGLIVMIIAFASVYFVQRLKLSGGPNASTSPSVSVSQNAELSRKLPESIKSAGVIKIGVDANYAPGEFLAADGTTVQGFDVDLFNAVAAKFGVKTEWQPTSFPSIISGVDSKKYDIGISSITINDKRKEQVKMVSYFKAGTQWASRKGNPKGVDPDNACGKNIAVQANTIQETDDLPARQKKCGSNKINVLSYGLQSEATSAVVSGKADAMLADSPVVAYAVKQSNGKLETLSEIYDAAPYGFVLPNGEGEFAQAIADALKQLDHEGAYNAALEKWGVEQGAISNFAVNP
jgi:polar amino acid transport system substrate-binding protein